MILAAHGILKRLSDDAPPLIQSISSNQTVEVGESITLEVMAIGTSPLSYQWYKNGLILSGEINSTLSIPVSDFVNSGKYQVQVTNIVGSIMSDKIVVVVSTLVINDLSDIPDLEFDFDLSLATHVDGKITQVVDNVGSVISSQGNPSLQPTYVYEGGINNLAYGRFDGGKKLTGDVLMQDADNVTVFVVRRLNINASSFNGLFGNGNANGYGFVDGEANRKSGLLPNQTAFTSFEPSTASILWSISTLTSSRIDTYKNRNYNIYGEDNSNTIPANTFETPTGFHTIGSQPTTNNSDNDIQRVFGYSRILSSSEIRSISEYISQHFNLPLPVKVVTEGDSITAAGSYPNYMWNTFLSDGNNFYVKNNAVSGSKTSDIINLRLADLVDKFDGRVDNILTLMIGHNDLSANVPVDTIWANIATICNTLKDAGYKIILQTVLISAMEVGDPGKMTELTDLNNRIITMSGSFTDLVVDSYNITELLDPSDTTYYVDGVHPTNPVGSNLIGDLLMPGILSLTT